VPSTRRRGANLTLFKLKTGPLLNLDLVSRITPQKDPVTKKDYLDIEISGFYVSVKDEQEVADLWDIIGKNKWPL
jgi:hypothetical protein